MLSAFSSEPLTTGGLAVYAWAFGQGVLVDFTPCVYPLIPITVAVFGAKGVSRGRALFLAAAYVLGMALLYTTLGVVVALSGVAFGSWLGNPWVVVPIAAMLVALAASMFGAFDVQLPTSLQGRLNQVGGAGPFGAFLMGLVSGLISAPCTGPVLLSLLAYIAKASAAGGGVLYGGSVLFAYALGMGTLFFAVALGASLFRAGPWMEHVKNLFGVMLLVMALWFLRPLSADLRDVVLDPIWGFWIGVVLAGAGLAGGAIHLAFKGSPWPEKLRKGVMVAVAVFGGHVAVNHVLYVPPMEWAEVDTLAELRAEVGAAEAAGRPLLVDFAATWCLPCAEMEKLTFHDPRVEARLARDFHLVKIDVTDPTEEQERMKEIFDSATLPSVLVFGVEAGLGARLAAEEAGTAALEPHAHFQTFVDADVFLDALEGL